MDNIILWIMAIAMVLGALDRMFGSRLGLGKQFEEGILAIGAGRHFSRTFRRAPRPIRPNLSGPLTAGS